MRAKYNKNLSEDELYSIYKAQYNKSSKSREAAYEAYYTKSDFIADLESEMKDIKKSGSSISKTRLAERMAKEDVYGATAKQIKKRTEVFKEYFEDTSITEAKVRTGKVAKEKEFWNAIGKFSEDMKKAGKSTAEIRLAVSQEFFGSET